MANINQNGECETTEFRNQIDDKSKIEIGILWVRQIAFIVFFSFLLNAFFFTMIVAPFVDFKISGMLRNIFPWTFPATALGMIIYALIQTIPLQKK